MHLHCLVAVFTRVARLDEDVVIAGARILRPSQLRWSGTRHQRPVERIVLRLDHAAKAAFAVLILEVAVPNWLISGTDCCRDCCCCCCGGGGACCGGGARSGGEAAGGRGTASGGW